MCTFVYYPLNQTIFLASLRDESPLRPEALPPALIESVNGDFIAPLDPLAGGTWIGIKRNSDFVVLLNGGFEAHERENNYIKSRGLIVKEMLQTADMLTYWNQSDFSQIEPFTIVLMENSELNELVWDGNQKHQKKLEGTQPAIWSSSTLYNEEVRKKRIQYFNAFDFGNKEMTFDIWRHFFATYQDPKNGFIMNRDEMVKTISFSYITIDEEHHHIRFEYDNFKGLQPSLFEIYDL